jgi:hypothetical protein
MKVLSVKIKEMCPRGNQDKSGNDRLGKMSCRVKRENGRKQRNCFGKTGGEASLLTHPHERKKK